MADPEQLTHDAVHHICSYLNSRDLSRVAGVNKTWLAAADDAQLWLKQLQLEFHRAASSLGPTDNPKHKLIQLQGTPVAQHAAWLARYHSATRLISGWRIVLQLHDAPQQQQQQATAPLTSSSSAAAPLAPAPQLATATTGDSDANQGAPAAHANPSTAGSAAASSSGAPEDFSPVMHLLRMGLTHTAGRVHQQEQSVWLQFPLPSFLAEHATVAEAIQEGRLELRVEAQLQDAAGSTQQLQGQPQEQAGQQTQQQEQLQFGPQAAPTEGRWVPVLISHPFKMPQGDQETMAQSHREGLYVWHAQQAHESRIDEVPSLSIMYQPLRSWQPLAAVTSGGDKGQQQQQSGPSAAGETLQQMYAWLQTKQMKHAMMLSEVAAGLMTLPQVRQATWELAAQSTRMHRALEEMAQATSSMGDTISYPAVSAQLVPLVEGFEQSASLGGSWQVAVYIHYEQLLQHLPSELPQALPVRVAPKLDSWEQLGQLLSGRGLPNVAPAQPPGCCPQVMWLHMDFQKFSTCGRLGSLVVPLYLARVSNSTITLASGWLDSDKGMTPAVVTLDSRLLRQAAEEGDEEEEEDAGNEGGQAQHDDMDDISQGESDVDMSATAAAEAQTAAGEDEPTAAAAAAAAEPEPPQPSRAELFAEQLALLLEQDEVMADLALFDAQGRLLQGRCGVELWSSDATTVINTDAVHQAAAAAGSGPVPSHPVDPFQLLVRTVYKLHFMVDGVDNSYRQQRLVLDPSYERAIGAGGVRLKLPWSAMGMLWGLGTVEGEYGAIAAAAVQLEGVPAVQCAAADED